MQKKTTNDRSQIKGDRGKVKRQQRCEEHAQSAADYKLLSPVSQDLWVRTAILTRVVARFHQVITAQVDKQS